MWRWALQLSQVLDTYNRLFKAFSEGKSAVIEHAIGMVLQMLSTPVTLWVSLFCLFVLAHWDRSFVTLHLVHHLKGL